MTVYNLKSLDGGILDQDDRLVDVVDDREQVIEMSINVSVAFTQLLFQVFASARASSWTCS